MWTVERNTSVLNPCIMSCESRAVHISYILCSGSLFQMWMGCKHGHYRVFFIYTHYTTGQYKRLSLARRGSRQNRILDVPDPDKCSLFRHKLSPGWHGTQMSQFCTYLFGSGVTVRYDFGTTGEKKSTMLGFFSFILNRQ